MTVKELIEQLQKMNPESTVYVAKFNFAETGDLSDYVDAYERPVGNGGTEAVIIDRS